MTIKMLIPLLWNIIWITICTSLAIFMIGKKQIDLKKRLTTIAYIYIIALIIINIAIISLARGYYVQGILQFFYEIISWAILIYRLYECKYLNKRKNIFDKCEKKISIISIIIGFICVGMLATSNIQYISPSNEYGYIENFYFNADVHRGIEEASTIVITHKIHPCYRFLMLPILLPIILLNSVLSICGINQYLREIISGYLLLTIQIFLNSTSNVLFYRILKQSKIEEKICFCGSILFGVSLSSIWLSILPETYAITLFTMLIYIYLYRKNNSLWILCAILSTSTNLMAILPAIILICNSICKNKETIIKKVKKISKVLLIFAIVILGLVMIISIYGITKYILEYLYQWSGSSSSIIENIKESFNYFLVILLIAPNSICNGEYFVQLEKSYLIQQIFFVFITVIAFCGYINKRKDVLTNLATMFLVIAYILHCLFGYGRCNGIIYAPIYSWAFILLIIYGINSIYKNNKKLASALIFIIIVATISFNCIWLVNCAFKLKNIEFKQSENVYSLQDVYLQKQDGENIHFKIIYNTLIKLDDGQIILKDLNGYTYNKTDNSITGLLSDSSWFKVYVEGNNLFLSKCGETTQINDEKFFLFGMGLREKFILKKGNSNYELLQYSNKNIILQNLTLDYIDAKNYTVYAYNDKKEKVIIYENEHGIYIKNNDKITAIDETININIPDFSSYKYEKQLYILFHEVMINITNDGPKPNFLAYDGVWYRDAAMMAMVLENTGNVNQISDWVQQIQIIYDEQNGRKEVDNLGQVLYLLSLIDNKNENLINEIIAEAEKLSEENGYLNGITDGELHPVYQTKWLIYGLEKLGLDSSKYKIPDIYDSYEPLTWFYEKTTHNNTIKIDTRWQYIYYAYLNYYNEEVEIKENKYPLSSEYRASKANFDRMNFINENYRDTKLVVPHGWGAAEMFLYLINWKN